MMRSSARAVTDLPEPLSPTSASVRPGLQVEADIADRVQDVRAQVIVDAQISTDSSTALSDSGSVDVGSSLHRQFS